MITLFNPQTLYLTVMSIEAQDVVRMDLDELKRTSRDLDVDPDDIDFPPMAHHMTVRGKLEALVEKEVITYEQMQEIYENWKEGKQ